MEPHRFPRRILLAVTGLSPQVVTETLYALAITEEPGFIPTEIHLITTARGAERARLELLEGESGWFHRLCRDYTLPSIDFTGKNIHTLPDADGKPLPDIRSREENVLAADFITAKVAELTGDDDTALHVSLAGGRKTMGYYLGYALSLYGREQDRLSHVLVSGRFENHPLFFYPTPYFHRIHAQPDQEPLDTSKAEVVLAEIPFVRLRKGLPKPLLGGRLRFSDSVAAAQRSLEPPRALLSYTDGTVIAEGRRCKLPPADLAFYGWLARRTVEGKEAPQCPGDDDHPDRDFAAEYLAEYRRIKADTARTEERLAQGMGRGFFEERKSRVNAALDLALGYAAEAYRIRMIDNDGRTGHGLAMRKENIRWEDA